MKKVTRRRFLQSSFAGAAALTIPSYSWGRVAGANDEIRVVVAGIRGRGRTLIQGLHSQPGVRVVGLCDVDTAILAREAARFHERDEKVQTHVDLRRFLDDPNIDVVATATPNHWHALQTIWSCQAGKDVYVEKPISHNIREGRAAVNAARRYGRIVQTGTQGRSSECIQEAVEFLHREKPLGTIRLARGFCYRRRNGIGRAEGPQQPPESVDYNLWLGPAPDAPVRRVRFHYDWHWFWDYGNGDIGNQGPHQMDMARWILGQEKLAPAVFSVGGRVGYDDDAETYNTQFAYLDYSPAPILFEVRNLENPDGMGNFRGLPQTGVSVVIEGDEGCLVIPSAYNNATFYDRNGERIQRFESPRGDHFANFIEAVRSRRSGDLNSGVFDGHLAAALGHMGNISNRLGSEAPPEEIRAAIAGDRKLTECFERIQTHLDANEVDIAKEKLKLGAALKMDPDAERFIENREANRLASGTYRPEFALPDEVAD